MIDSESFCPISTAIDYSGQYTDVELIRTTLHGRLYRMRRQGRLFVAKTTVNDDARSLELLKREYELTLGLSHPNIIHVYSYETDTPVGAAIIMEYIDGCSLTECLAERPDKSLRHRIFEQLLSATDYLHKAGVLHNDLKPENILVSRTNHDIRIIDFGFADNDSHYQERMLGTTRGYASPELIKHSDEIDARSDIYAIGCIMQQMFPNRYKQIVKRCIHPNKTRRFSNIEQLAKAWHRRKQPYRIAAMLLVAVLILLPTLLYIYERTERIEQAQRTEQRQQLCDSLYQAIDHEFKVQYTITRDSINAINAQATTQAYSDALIMIAHFYRRTRIIQEEILSSATDRTMQMQLGFHCNQVYGTYQNQLVTDAEQWKHTIFQ
jgi:serine/threonine protein kinase